MKTSIKFLTTKAFIKRNLPSKVYANIGWGAGTSQEVTGCRPEQRAILLGGEDHPISLDYISSIRDYYVEIKSFGNIQVLRKFNENVTEEWLTLDNKKFRI